MLWRGGDLTVFSFTHLIRDSGDASEGISGFDTNFYEQWSPGLPAERIWWSKKNFSGPDNN